MRITPISHAAWTTAERGLSPFRRAPEEYWQMYYQATEKRLRQSAVDPDDPAPYALAV